MNLGSETGSLVNHVISSRNSVEPTLGMGATLLSWSDRRGGTVTFVGKIVTVAEDHAVRTDSNGVSESQTYEHTPNENGRKSYFRRNKKGGWDEVGVNMTTGRWNRIGAGKVVFGRKETYHDYSF